MNSKKVFTYLISLIICSLPLPLIISTIFYVALVFFTIYYAIVNKIKPNFKNVYFILFYTVMVLSYFWSIDKNLTIIGIGRKSAFLILPILFAFIPKFNSEEIKRVFRYFTYAMVLNAIFFISMSTTHFLLTGSLSSLTRHELVSPLNLNRIYVSLFTVVAVFHLIYNEKKNFINILLLVLLAIFILLLSSKTIILTTIIVLIVLSLRKKISIVDPKNILFATIILVIGFGIFKYNPKFYSELIPTKYREVITKKDFEKNYYFNGAELRILYSRFLFEFEKEQDIFFTGFGLNATQDKLNEKCIQYKVPDGYGTEFNFHNQYNQTLAELGVFVLLLLISILYLGFRKAIKNRDRFSIAVLIIFIALLFTESVFNRQRGIYFFIIVYCLLNTTHENLTRKNNMENTPKRIGR